MNSPAIILLVEDNLADAKLTAKALSRAKIAHVLHVVDDGEKALDFLYQRGAYCDAPRPDLVLLDLNLPKKNGREVLQEVKANPALLQIPIVVLSTSHADQDVSDSYHSHANSYIRKPSDFPGFMAVVSGINDYWLNTVRLPATT